MSISSVTTTISNPGKSGGGSVVPSFPDQKIATVAADVATPAPSPERVTQAVKKVNDAFSQNGQNLYASIEKDKATGITVIKVYDNNTKEEISQYPSKAIVAIADSINQSAGGKVQLMQTSA